MSKNITALSKRQGLKNNLFERLVENKDKQALAKSFLIGDSVVAGAASFYDFIEGDNAHKKAYVCNGSSCLCAGTQDKVTTLLETHFDKTEIGHVACLGRCHENSAFQIKGDNYSGKDIHQLDAIVKKAHQTNEHYQVVALTSKPILTEKPQSIELFYHEFFHQAQTQSPSDLLQIIIDSNLRGRGGAGFPTGIKWQACAKAPSQQKYIVCNADEGDPGAFSDRYLLEQNPHLVLLGMLVAGFLVGANTGVLYIRDEYPESITKTEQAISEFNTVFSNHEFSKQFAFQFKIIRGAGAYICGEETALLRSIEGQRPIVSTRPPFPVTSGLYGEPTVLNNVETFAAVPWILKHGANAFKQKGNGRSTGTKLLSLDSAFNQPGIYEVDMGVPLEQVIEQAGGFSKPIKALHIGGPLGGLVPVAKIKDLTVDFESFQSQHFLLGHASIIGIPESMPLIEYARHLFEFTAMESCGKCFPCRLGATRGEEMINDAINQKNKINESLLRDLLETMQFGSLCALGGGVPLPLYNMLEHFYDEFVPYLTTAKSERIAITEVN